MKKILGYIFIFGIIFFQGLFSFFSMPDIFQTWDVILECILVLILIISYKKVSFKPYFKTYISLILIIITGLLSNIIFKNQPSIIAIIRDILSFLKFPLIFILLKQLSIDKKLSSILDEKFYKILKIVIIVMLSLGIISIFFNIGLSLNEIRFHIRPYKFIFAHPTYLVLAMSLILSLLEYNTEENLNKYKVMALLIVVLTMRTKGLAFVVTYVILKFFSNKGFKKTILFVILLAGVTIVSYSKISLYSSFASSTREVLYKGTIEVVGKSFPLGSGFGTYASHISGMYKSKVYDYIDVSYALNGHIPELGDVGYPYYIGQFGIIGIILLIILSYNIYKKSTNCYNKMPVYIVLSYLLIALTTESTLLNMGAEIAIILATISVNKVRSRQDDEENKIAVISELNYENANYGNRLQAFALNYYLNKNYKYETYHIVLDKYDYQTITKFYPEDYYIKIKNKLNKIINKIRKKNTNIISFEERINNCNKFTSNTTKVLKYRSEDFMYSKFMMYITGSDVVWSQHKGIFNNIRFLNLYNKSTRFSYAASFGKDYIPKENAKYINKTLEKYKMISVREGSSVSLLSKIGIESAIHVCDPTLLLTKEDYRKIETPVKGIHDKYIFTYLLGKNRLTRETIIQFAKKNDLIIVNIPHANQEYSEVDNDFADIDLPCCSPGEWIWLIDNAQYVITDSFHGCAFSTIFEKKFYIIKRESNENINNRMIDYLKTIGELNKFVKETDLLTNNVDKNWNYSDINKLKTHFINKSKEYIDKAIK